MSSSAFAISDLQSAIPPIQRFKLKMADFLSTETQVCQTARDGIVPFADWVITVKGAKKSMELRFCHSLG
jgi:hypothetical protein